MPADTMTQPQIAGENARRLLGRIAAAAREMEMRDHLLIDLVVTRNGRVVQSDTAIDPMAAVSTIRQTQAAVHVAGGTLAFVIRPVFPRATVDHDGVALTRAGSV